MYFVVLLFIFIIILYFHSVLNHNFWKKKNVTFVKPWPFYVSQLYKLIYKPTFTEIITKIYKMFPNEDLIGYFIGGTPGLLITNPLLIKHVLYLDFEHFVERAVDVELANSNLFISRGDVWRILRRSLTPAFSINKLKKMYPLIVKCARRLQYLGDKIVTKGGITDAYEVMSRFTMEFICNCGVGVDLNIIMDEHSKFYDLATHANKRNKWQNMLVVLEEILPLPNWIKSPYFLHDRVKKFLNDIILEICEKRNFMPSDRHDFIDLLLELTSMGKIKGESIDKKNPDGTPAIVELDLTDTKLFAAQVYVFFLAGYETSASSTSFTLHQLAYHPDIQIKIQEQIDKVLLEYNNKLCYEAVAKMSLLEMAYLEALRMFPPGGVLRRVCSKKYKFPGTNITIDPGLRVVIPLAAIQNDPKYFPDPHEFKPERFAPEAVKERDKYVYLPFGQGKRMCIGSRLGQMQSLAGLAALLQRFSVEPAPRSQRNIKLNRTCRTVQGIDGGVPIKLVPRLFNTQD